VSSAVPGNWKSTWFGKSVAPMADELIAFGAMVSWWPMSMVEMPLPGSILWSQREAIHAGDVDVVGALSDQRLLGAGGVGTREVLVKGFVDEVVICAASEVIARHPRSYEREDMKPAYRAINNPSSWIPSISRRQLPGVFSE
jgi:hypothetical protein